ncbi:hypothetical protein ANCCAN_19873 [Ancylostoma caninum]|uniref:Lipid-binding serum glycoprotein N-terminal domain-containing protein n=1 Tax=Ancylostoma caninum TaxID=29170 RepID=A0A368FS05_ANCCA|nr:hypothetical protein ANCCAN_19873 [Ancylostoma caninum]
MLNKQKIFFLLQEGLASYRVYNGRVDYFNVPKWGAYFHDDTGGIHSSMDLQFGATTSVKVLAWIFPISGQVKIKSERARIHVRLAWNDFKFIPYVSVDSKLRVEFTHGLRVWLNSRRGKVEQTVNSKLMSEVPRMLKEAVERHVNPRLQNLKQKLISKNYTHFDIDWKAQGGFLRVAVKPRSSSGVDSVVKPIKDMVCVDLNVLAAIDVASKRIKTAVSGFKLIERLKYRNPIKWSH